LQLLPTEAEASVALEVTPNRAGPHRLELGWVLGRHGGAGNPLTVSLDEHQWQTRVPTGTECRTQTIGTVTLNPEPQRVLLTVKFGPALLDFVRLTAEH
jgi:hypothetical protein